MDDADLQHRLDELHAECVANPAEVAALYLTPSLRRLLRSCEAVRRAADTLARRLDHLPPPDAPPPDDAVH